MYIPERLKYYIRCTGWKIISPFCKKKRDKLFDECKKEGIENIPIFIISYNRLSYLKDFIRQMEKYHLKNLHIIDNCSTYPPLLDFYKTIPYHVDFMDENKGHLVFWKDERFKEYRKKFYVVTDPDLQITDNCPEDFMDFFFNKLRKYPFVRKIGFSLKIDACLSEEIISWEKQYYKTKIKRDNLYYAGIDTTFALYIPDQLVFKQKFLSAFRSGEPYQMKHLPWYKEEITEEDIFYASHKSNGWFDPVKGFKIDKECI